MIPLEPDYVINEESRRVRRIGHDPAHGIVNVIFVTARVDSLSTSFTDYLEYAGSRDRISKTGKK